MQIQRGVLEMPVSQEQLDGAQVGSSLQHVGRETVAQCVGTDSFSDARAQSRFMTGVPDRFVGGRLLLCRGPPAGKQVNARLPLGCLPIIAEGSEQFLGKRKFPVARSFALV